VDVDDREDVTRALDASDAPTSDTNPPTSAREIPEGATFGRYVVARKLGSGGMGVVYLAYDPQLDRGVALEVLHLHTRAEDDGMAQDRLIREAQAMARLSHPNVVPVSRAPRWASGSTGNDPAGPRCSTCSWARAEVSPPPMRRVWCLAISSQTMFGDGRWRVC